MLAEAKHRLRRASISSPCSHHHFLLPYLQYKSGDTLNDSNVILANRETAEQLLNIHTVQENIFWKHRTVYSNLQVNGHDLNIKSCLFVQA